MKIFLDEDLPKRLKAVFNDKNVIVKNADDMIWKSYKNGQLLKKLCEENFDVFITQDGKLKEQQNLKKFNIIIVLIKAVNNKLATLEPLLKKNVNLIIYNKSKRFLIIK
jgi:predicted nuclease of predicted toxin-antitoxin system